MMPNDKKEIPPAQVVRVAELTAYQEGAIVSRTLLHRPTSTVTLFAFDRDQGLSEHTTPFDALAHILDGEVEITISGESMRAAAGEMVLMPANQPHALRAVTPFKMLLIMIRS